ERVAERALHLRRERAGAGEQARPGDRRERHSDLELRIVIAAGALEGVGPAVIEHVFALGVTLGVAGRDAEDRAAGVLRDQMLWLPAGARSDRVRLFKRGEECM